MYGWKSRFLHRWAINSCECFLHCGFDWERLAGPGAGPAAPCVALVSLRTSSRPKAALSQPHKLLSSCSFKQHKSTTIWWILTGLYFNKKQHSFSRLASLTPFISHCCAQHKAMTYGLLFSVCMCVNGCFLCGAGAEASFHLPERSHSWAANPRAMDEAELRTSGHHHQHHGVHPQAEGWCSGQCLP